MSRGTPAGKVSGAPCPKCGSVRTYCRDTGYTDAGDRVRKRFCPACPLYFITAELVLPADLTWGEVAPSTREKDREVYRARYGWRPRPELYGPTAWLDLVVRVTRRGGRRAA